MKCLILASGQGLRLKNKGDSKPLVHLLGLPLIERVILTGHKAGLTDFYVVTGFNGEKVREHLEKFSSARNISITIINNNDWKRENGVSVLKAKDEIRENFILLMSDHIFDESILLELKNQKIADDEIMLAVDYNIKDNKFVDIDDVTKVNVQNNNITDIGKNISEYNAYDTGIFLCSPAIFSAIKESLHDNDSSLSGGVKKLAVKGKAKTFDIKNNYWIDVDNEDMFKKAKKLLYSSLDKPLDGFISRYINRKFSMWVFTPLFLKIYGRITPNQVSVVSFIVSLISGLLFFLQYAVIGGVLIQLASILDGCDGEIARIKKMSSKFGNFFDAVLDRYADSFILLGIFYHLSISLSLKELFGDYWYPLIISISLLAIVGNLMVSYTSTKSIVDFGYRYKGRWIAAGKGRDWRLFFLFIGGVMTFFHPIFLFIALFIIAILTNAIVLRRTFLSWNYSLNKDSFIHNNIKAVIFDFDGTIADTMPFLTDLAVQLIIKNYNLTEKDAKKRYLDTTGIDFAAQLELIFPNHPNNQQTAEAFEKKKLEDIFAYPIFSEAIPTIKYFKNKRIKTFICSSTKQEIITKYSKLNKIDGLVDGLFGYKTNFRKTDQIDFVLRHYKIKPDEALFIGDSLKDYNFSNDKKIEFIGISGIIEKNEFKKRGILCVNNLTNFVKLFEKSEKILNSFEKVDKKL